MADQISQVSRPKEIFTQMGEEIYRQAYDAGLSVAAWLEVQDPSEKYQNGTSAWTRQLQAAQIRTQHALDWGVYADSFGAFDRSDQHRALLPEWTAMQVRAVRHRSRLPIPNTREASLYGSSDFALGSIANPYATAPGVRTSRLGPAIPVGELIAMTTPITASAYQAFYLTDDTDEMRMKRVLEGTEVPAAKLTGSERYIQLKKRGRAFVWTYEAMRVLTIPMVQLHIQRLAVQTEVDMVTAAIDTLINGDGNANTAAAVTEQSALDSDALAGVPSLRAWLLFKMSFGPSYNLTHVLAQNEEALELQLMNVGSANVPMVTLAPSLGMGGFRVINRDLADGTALGWTSDVPAGRLLGFDSSVALELVTQVGATLTETARVIRRQTEELVMTTVDGFAVIDTEATRILNLSGQT